MRNATHWRIKEHTDFGKQAVPMDLKHSRAVIGQLG